MKDRLASDVLAKVMTWGAAEVAAVAPKLQMLASHKYDSYEGYKPGVKFLENLSAWLARFPDLPSRRVALRFVLDQLVFVSRAELDHLIETVYPDIIRPMVMRETAELLGVSPFAVARIAASPLFLERQRKILVLGLSDGARIDRLRRSSPGLSHEQIYLATDLGDETMSDALTSVPALSMRLLSSSTSFLSTTSTAVEQHYYAKTPEHRRRSKGGCSAQNECLRTGAAQASLSMGIASLSSSISRAVRQSGTSKICSRSPASVGVYYRCSSSGSRSRSTIRRSLSFVSGTTTTSWLIDTSQSARRWVSAMRCSPWSSTTTHPITLCVCFGPTRPTGKTAC